MGMKQIYTILVGIIDAVLLVVIVRAVMAKEPEAADAPSSRGSASSYSQTVTEPSVTDLTVLITAPMSFWTTRTSRASHWTTSGACLGGAV